jgi:hypothetical protein
MSKVENSDDRMLYKAGGKHEIHGGKFDYIVVDESEVEAKLKEGWFKTTPEALEAAQKAGQGQTQGKTAKTAPAATVGTPSGAWSK